ncbi:copper homeostasis protein cutC homolog [Pollicipes pollicipes]|uniref:copper homeostasis protein cutC homolog n=1 Tax=Pollicipes pollicipes TaxID=41117 RepID=UPI0018850567|nr:copper homeostasis protein cutC homolog [Pollicipes pollicipes]
MIYFAFTVISSIWTMLEVCVDSVDSAVSAADGGADRLELCAALSEGGLTPSLGLLTTVKKLVQIPVFVLIRCRQGDFVYSSDDMDVMEADIQSMKKAGADGFVFGCLDESGAVDQDKCYQLLRVAAPLSCTFHRAFDCTLHPEQALTTIIKLGFVRLLTSGQAPSALEGAALIGRLVSLSAGRLTVMPGGGVTPQTAPALLRLTGVRELHASARSARSSALDMPAGVTMGAASDERHWLQCDPAKVKAIKRAFVSGKED